MAVRRQPIPFGKYFLLDRINIGGMAEVWRAKTFGEQGFEKLVAIKRILPNIAEDDEFITMFIDEAKITVQLTHANVAQVFDLGKIGDSYFIAMEYVAGKDLRAIFDRCRKKAEPAPIPMVCYMISKMCEGLDYAHRKKDASSRDLNIVHRDVSPQNCLVSFEGEIKVIDFGIAKAANKATKTQAGILKGKFGYMSPEQVRGLPLDQRSDVFAAGVVLYEMLTGERLFIGDSDFSVLEKVRQVDILPPTKYNRRIPEGLEKIVLKALTKDPEERFTYASDLADALQRFLIINDTIFSRKDLAQYMKSTFAEDVEKEKVRQAEYAEIKLPASGPAAGPRPTAATPAFRGAPPPALAPARPPPPPAAPPPPPQDFHADATAPAAVERTVIDGHDVFADAAPPPRPATPPPPPVVDLAAEEIIAEANPRPPPPVAPPVAPPVPRPGNGQPPREAVGRPLPPNLGQPAQPRLPPPVVVPRGPIVERNAPPPTPYKPRLPELENVTDRPTSNRSRVLLFGGVGLAVAALAGAAAFYFLTGKGTLIVDYEPADARVMLDGVEVCTSAPCAANELKPGKRMMEIRKDRYESHTEVIDIPRGDIYRASPKVKLRPLIATVAFVVASEPADAQVSIDGKVVKDLGKAGLYMGELKIGEEHLVEVGKPGYGTWKKAITPSMTDKPPINEFAQLARQAFVVTFTSNPPGAKVLVDDKPRGTTPVTLEDLDPSANHAVVLQKACYKDATATLMAGSGSTEIKKDLEKKPKCD